MAAGQSAGRTARGASTTTARQLQAQGFIRGLTSEFRRITWPTRREWVSATILTLILVVGVGFFTYGVDRLCDILFGLIHRQ